jgi:hypothetical protein
LSVDEVQAQLRVDEALVLFLVTSDSNLHRFQLREETFVWVATKSEVRLVRTDLGENALLEKVGALRCGLDNTQWENDFTSDWCSYLLRGYRRYDAGPYANVLTFPLGVAHTLYQDLFGQFEDLIRGKHLLIVPSGSLTQLPFQVLVTARPKKDGPHNLAEYREAAWLGVRQPITVLPMASSLKVLRTRARASQAAKAYLGIGNPLLDGRPGEIAGHAELAKLARAYARCRVGSAVATLARRHGGVEPIKITSGLADVAYIKLQPPLPETAEELCAVAADLKADVGAASIPEECYGAEAKPRFGKQTASINRRTSVKAMSIRTIGNAARLVAAIAFITSWRVRLMKASSRRNGLGAIAIAYFSRRRSCASLLVGPSHRLWTVEPVVYASELFRPAFRPSA